MKYKSHYLNSISNNTPFHLSDDELQTFRYFNESKAFLNDYKHHHNNLLINVLVVDILKNKKSSHLFKVVSISSLSHKYCDSYDDYNLIYSLNYIILLFTSEMLANSQYV